MQTTQVSDPSIYPVLAELGPDLTAREWAEKLDVTLDDVLHAFERLGTQAKPEYEHSIRAVRRHDQAAAILDAIGKGHYTTQAIAAYTGLHPQTTRYKLAILLDQKVVGRYGKGKNIRWVLP